MEKQMMDILNELLEGQRETNTRLEKIEKKLGAIENQVAQSCETVTEIKVDTEMIKSDLSRVEIGTAENWKDIAVLKAKIQ